MIKIVNNIDDMRKCDALLNLLILDEQKYDNSINESFLVNNHFEKICNDNNILLGYYIDSDIVGFIFMKYIDDTTYRLSGLYVKEDCRKKKIATSLINEAINICKDKNIKYVDINVMYKNDLAKHIYESLGFKNFRMTMRKELDS